METAIRVCVLGVVCAVLASAVRKQAPTAASALTLAGCTAAAFLLLSPLEETLDAVQNIAERAEISPAVISAVWKTTAIAVISRFAASFCRDAGNSGAAVGAESAGCVCGLCAAIPLLESVVEMVEDLF